MWRTSVATALRAAVKGQRAILLDELPVAAWLQTAEHASAEQVASRLQQATATLGQLRSFATVIPDAEKDAAKEQNTSPQQQGQHVQEPSAHAEIQNPDTAQAGQPQGSLADLQHKVTALDQQLLEKESQIEEEKDRLLRALADLENLRERSARQAETTRKFALQGFAKSMLEVADNLERALDIANQPSDAAKAADQLRTLTDGLKLTDKILLQVFKQNGLERYEALGEKFDPNLHEALFEVPDPAKTAGTVGVVTKAGYRLHDRVLRPAEVGVVQADTQSAAAE